MVYQNNNDDMSRYNKEWHKRAKINELKYFAPFDWIKDQCKDLIPSNFFCCDMNRQQQLFLFMACSDNIENDYKKHDKYCYLSDLLFDKGFSDTKWRNSENFLKLKKRLENRYFTYINNLWVMQFRKDVAIKLNKKIKETKDKIKKYIKKSKIHIFDNTQTNDDIINRITHDHKTDEVPYIFYLEKIIQMFEIYNASYDKQNEFFNVWNEIFNFQNDTDLLNFQGCLGLLLMNEFCFYYNNNQLRQSVLCAMLLTVIYRCSPLSQRYEQEYLKELNQRREKERKISEQNARNAHNKANTPQKIAAREKIFEMAREIYKNNSVKSTNYIADKISNKILLEGNKKDYGINAENPKNTIYSWLNKYPNEWKQ